MASLVVLKGMREAFDLTRYIPVGKYTVNDVKDYKQWEDANYTIHKRLKSKKAEGSFTLIFPNILAYENFINELELREDNSGSISMDVWCNNTHRVKTIKAFVEFEPQNDLPLLADHKSNGFEVKIQERG